MAADRRSIYPNLPGLPWWGAVLVATGATMAGIVLDAAGKELTSLFAALYVLGCVVAVLSVRQSGVFTAVSQPPLILFCAVPGAYWLFHGATFTGVKTILINCGYPLIERFPLMLFTSAGVLLIGLGRWYFGAAARPATAGAGSEPAAGPGRLASLAGQLAAKVTALADRKPAHTTKPTRSRPARPTPARRSGSAARSSAPSRSRHVRPPLNEPLDPRAEPPRPRRPAYARGDEPPPRRRPRPAYRPAEPEPRERYVPPPRAGNIPNPTHHPVSRVRYRRSEPNDQSR